MAIQSRVAPNRIRRFRWLGLVLGVVVITAVVAYSYFAVHPSRADVQSVPVYRMANWITHERLFTTSTVEVNHAIAAYPGWINEGIGFYSPPSSYPNSLPVYRMANWITHERLFTTSAVEVNHAIAAYPGWVNEGIGFYSVPSSDSVAVPVYRLANWITHERLFTTSTVEVNHAIAAYPGWVNEGIGFYAENPTGSTPTPIASPSVSPGSATMYLSPATQSVANGSNLTFDIHENSGSDTVNAVQANLSYDISKFQFVSITATTSAFGIAAPTSGGGGQISIARGVSGGSPAVSGDQIVASVTLKAINTGVTSVTAASGSALARSTDSKDILSDQTGGTFTITP